MAGGTGDRGRKPEQPESRDPGRGERRRLVRLPGRHEEELDDEVRFHLQETAARLVGQGWEEEAARQEARRRFGDVERAKAGMRRMTRRKERRMRMETWRDTLSQDLRYAVRQLRRSPVFTTVAVLTLALGIGANTAIFSVVDGILFRPLPFPEPHELVNVWTDVTRRGGPRDEWLSYANFADLREGAETLEHAAAWGGWAPTWTDPERPEQLRGARITRGMFSDVLRVEPRLGSGLRPSDDDPGAAPRVLLSDGFWHRAFGGDPAAVGRRLTLDGETMEVAGVMPAGFRPPFVPDADVWISARVDPAVQAARRGGFSWRAVARVSEASDPGGADAELRRLGSRLEASHPESNTGMTFRAVPLREDLTASARSGLLVLLGAVGIVLLVACVNVANLLLARATGRTSEMAVRHALGASRGRLVGQLLTESVLLAAVGGIAAVAVAFLATDLLVSLAPSTTPRLDEVAVDGRVLAFTALVTLLAGGLFGLTPALRAARSDPREALHEGARGGVGDAGARLRGLLVSSQVALALVLLVGAGLLARSFDNLRSVELGFEPAGVTTFQLFLGGAYETPERVAFARELEERLAALPGVDAVGLTGTLPLSGFDGDASFHVEGRPLPEPGREPAAWIRQVTPGYLPAMEIEILRGRAFGDADVEGDREVVIVNETLAARWFPGEDPVGRRITFSDPAADDPFWREIVGVARDIRNFGIRTESRMAVYLPWAQAPGFAINGVVRTDVPGEELVPALRTHVAELDPDLAVARIQPMTALVERALAPERFLTLLLSLFAAVGVTLAAVGLYGVVSWSVGRRVRELGMRMALGAGTARIAGMVVRGSLALVGAGVVVGLGAVLLLTGLLDGLLFGVEATDPATLAAVVLLLVGVAAVAAAVPALRAAAVDPARALRGE